MSGTTTSHLLASGNLRSISAMLVAVGFFAWMDTLIKLLSAHYPAMQVAALRGWVALPLIALWITARRGWASCLRVRWGLHLIRGGLAIAMLTSFAYGVRSLPLATTYTLFFVAPLLMTMLAGPILGERVPNAHKLAVVSGMVGVLVALRPTTQGMLSLHGLAILASAACYALAAVLARLSSRSDSSESLMLWIMVIMALGASTLAAPQWVAVRPQDATLWAALAVAGFGGQLAITEAFRHGQASAVAPFEYTALAWGLGVDWVMWQALPDGWTLAGGAIVISSGLLVLRHERIQVGADHP